MSFNQSRGERSDSSQYRKSGGRSGTSAQPRKFSGGSGKGGGGPAPPPSSTSTDSSLSSNRSVRKPNNAQGGQSRVSSIGGNPDSSYASARTLQNGAHVQPSAHGAADAPVAGVSVKPATDISTQKSAQAVPKDLSSQPAIVNSNSTAPATPAKGEASKSFPFQFGSINPSFMNGMQIPARTNSAPPNLDEQQRDQARHDSQRTVPPFPVPSVPKKQIPRKDGDAGDQSSTVEAHQMSKSKRDVQFSSPSPVTQTQKTSIHHIAGVSMPMPFQQSQVPVQLGGPNPQIQSHNMAATSLPVPMPMPLPMGSSPQLQQSVFVPSLQPHPMQPQGIMHQGQSLNFPSQMGPHMPSQLGNLGISIGAPFAHQAGKFGVQRKPVKITHPDTHEELRLGKRADAYIDGGSSGSRSHPNVPQSQPITSIPPAYPINYYSNSYNSNPLFFPAASSVPLTSTQINPSSQAPRFSYPPSQSTQTPSFMNPSAHNSYSSKNSSQLHGISEPSSLEHSRGIHSAMSSAPPASVQVTVKQAIGLNVEKIADLSQVISIPSIEKGESPPIFQHPGEDSTLNIQSSSDTLQQPKHGLEPTSSSVTVAGEQSTAASPPADAPLEKSSPVVTNSTGNRRDTMSRSDSIKDQQQKQVKKGFSQPQRQVPGQSSSISSLPPKSSELAKSFTIGNAESIATAASSNRGVIEESTREALSTHSAATADAPEFKADSGEQGSTCESSEASGCSAIVDGLEDDHHARQHDSSPQNEPLKLETMGTRGVEVPQEDKYSPMSSAESISTKTTELVNQTGPNSGANVTTNSHDVNLEVACKDSEEPLGQRPKDDVVTDELLIPTSLAPDDTNDKSSPTSYCDSRTSISDVSCNRSDSLGSRQSVVTKFVPSDDGQPLVSTIPSVSEPTLEREGECSEYVDDGLVSLPAAGSKDKLEVEFSRSKSNVAKGKKKRKEILQKADALGTTSDLYMAYKGPEEKNETVASLESISCTPSVISNQDFVDTAQNDMVSKKLGQNKSEPDDWEDAADMSTPKLEALDDEKKVHGRLSHHSEDGNGVTAKKYSRDFLLKFSEQCNELPDDLEIKPDIAEAFMASNLNASRGSHHSPGRIIDRPSSISRLDRRGSGLGDDDKWNKLPSPLVSGRDPRMEGYGGNFRSGQVGNYGVLKNPRAQTSPQYVGGILSGPMQSPGSQGGMQRTLDSDRWQRATSFHKGLIPAPQTPLQVMHKAEKKYEVGKVSDEEVAKQRQLKAILNKLTPQNFEKLFEQVKAVNIDSAVTLTGVISQIFDKALMEPTFCEMYANFCFHLAGELPDFSEDNEKITFKRLLLNKCQEEFERDAREQEEADRADEEGEVKQSEGQREEKRIQARRRMLGNIRLIGELYKKKMLTERIMHECIKKLLGQYQNPDEEDIEALCKLMSTIGEMIDHPKAKEHMDAYFDMMAKLSNNMELSSRLRFMLKDAIDLRKNKWQQRRKVEGPKKIEEVHRDAAQERHVQAGRLARAPSINSSARNRPSDFGPRGSGMLSSPNTQMGSLRGLPPQVRGYGNQDARWEDRHSSENRVLSVPLPQRPTVEDSITLGPQGGLARGMSIRGQPSMPTIPVAEDSRRMPTGLNGYSSASERTVYSSREDLMPRHTPDTFSTSRDRSGFGNREVRNADRSRPISPIIHGREQTLAQSISSHNVFSEERLRDKSLAAIKEFYSAKDEKEVADCVKELNAPSFYPTMISIWVTDSFERKDMERDLLAKLLINLSKSQDATLNGDHLIRGFESVLATLEDAVNDAPKAGEFLGRIFAKIIIENVIPFPEIGQLIYEGGEEQGSLVEVGLAAEVVGTILETVTSEKGDSVLNEIRSSSSLKIDKFRPPGSKKPLRLDKFI